MRLQPRQTLLEIWKATVRLSSAEGDKNWVFGGVTGTNSLSDAEQLLCILLPATAVGPFGLDQPNSTPDDVVGALRGLGNAVDIPLRLVRALTQYMDRYTDDTGTPVFSGQAYFSTAPGSPPPTAEQANINVVDSFTMSIGLTLATLTFSRGFRSSLRRQELIDEVRALEEKASARLTAAMIGMLRSFTVNSFEWDSPEGRTLVDTVNQARLPARQVADDLWRSLADIRGALREVTIGFDPDNIIDLDHQHRLFECGWTWGVARGAPRVDTNDPVGEQEPGIAEAAPYLYFSVVALNGIANLFTERTRTLGLLNAEQVRLATALQLRWEITQRYWSTLASFGSGRWPLEDIPWRTADNVESDYFSLLVTAMTVQDLLARRASDQDLLRVVDVLDELAVRGRITRRPLIRDPSLTTYRPGEPHIQDPALNMHWPGVPITLNGSDVNGGPVLTWPCTDYTPVLLKRVLQVANLMSDTDLRGQLLTKADAIWENLLERRIHDGPAHDLWDQVSHVYPQIDLEASSPSWYYTERVVECVLEASTVINAATLRNERLAARARDLLNEAEQLFDREQLAGSDSSGPPLRDLLYRVRVKLERVREIIDERPGTAFSLVITVLEDLDRLAAARSNVD
ncbi:SCO2524 family protein [Luedemannella flava]|uniref:SCO2524 family protein n=1 Tax=Luedemannella flava TaxID=349316 RepID=A0ABN2MJ28_9ACTN